MSVLTDGISALVAKTATPEEVFKSVGESLDAKINPNHVILIVIGLIVIIVLLKYFTRDVENRTPVKSINNPGRLTRELARQLGLKQREIRQLRQLAEQEGLEHPLTLLLCPSVLRSAIQKRQKDH